MPMVSSCEWLNYLKFLDVLINKRLQFKTTWANFVLTDITVLCNYDFLSSPRQNQLLIVYWADVDGWEVCAY